ncbi:hypothetical protein PMKS-002558 [Pichia membranifaciens]|uniref:Sas10 C-terminal domain-containing protein n=1 Tax=Pichia membranifaciens TaxID=4926 RepID=A0A1Q2YHR9_9ASCO|nr:hypothetical protein PMKS-002558 [Pichia membranifaciens]
MARRARSSARVEEKKNEETGIEEFGMDEVDAFADARDKSLVEKAGLNDKSYDVDHSDDEEAVEGVMDIDSDAEVEKYKKKFQGPIDESDEEYFRAEDDSGAEDEGAEGRERWGGDYYGADEAEDEEDEKLLEEEALRLQKKHMEELNMEDFMLDEVEDWESEKQKKRKQKQSEEGDESEELGAENDEKFAEMLKKGDNQSRTEMINKKYPEYLPLVLELKELQDVYESLKSSKSESVIEEVQFKALSLYLGSIVSYLAVFASKLQSGEKFDMKDEDVMVSILSSRELWRQAKGLRKSSHIKSGEEEDEEDEEEAEYQEESVGSESEEKALLNKKPSKSAKDDLTGSDVSEDEEATESKPQEKTPDFTKLRSIKKTTRKKLEDMDDLDAEDKKGRRKTLGFYTSKIDKRDIGKAAVDGDVDAAYEEVRSNTHYAQKRRSQPSQRGRRRRH